jgi:hypothetical protein
MLSGEQILDRLRNDSKLLSQPGTSPVLIRSARRFIWFYHWLNSARYLPPDRARDRALARALDRDRYRVLDLDRALAAYMLNRLCIVEKRAEGNLPVVEGLWLARVRERRENPEQPTAAGRH